MSHSNLLTNEALNQAAIQPVNNIVNTQFNPVNPKGLPERLGQKPKVNNDPYPVDALGNVLAPMARALNESIQAPLGLCGQSVLMTGALVAQGFRNVEIDGRTYPLSLFALTISESGGRKSAVDSQAKAPLLAYEIEKQEQYRKDLSDYKDRLEAFNFAKGNLKKDLKELTDPSVIQSKLESIGKPPLPPMVPTLLCSDPTIEGLIKHLRYSLPNVGVYTDEGAEFFGGHSMSREKVQKTIAQYSRAWDGSALDMMRSSDDTGAFKLNHRRVSINLMLQPVIAKTVFSDPLLVQQGFIPRFLISYPESTMGSRAYKDTNIKSDPRYNKYFARIKSLLDKGFNINPEDGGLDLLPLTVSTRAKDLWIVFHNEIESKLTKDGDLRHVSGTAAKIAEQALRVAGVLTVISSENKNSYIAETEMKAGIEIAQYSLNQLLAMNELSLVSKETEDARKLLNWIADNQYPFLYSNLNANKRPNSIRPKQAYEMAVSELLEYGYIEAVADMELDGRKRKNVFKVIHYFEPED